MEVRYLLLSLLLATLGFRVWFALSSSLRLPTSYQIQYDINTSYFYRILRRRLAGFLIYGLLPWLLIFHYQVLGDISQDDLGFNFAWNTEVTFWMAILGPAALAISFFNGRTRTALINYPEMRLTIWTPAMLIVSALFWVLFLVGMEYLFRGLVLHALAMNAAGLYAKPFFSLWMPIIVSTGIYAMIHYFKEDQISWLCIVYGLVLGYVTLKTGSLLPTVVVHVLGGFVTEWSAIYRHPEIKVQRKLYQ